MTEEIDKQAASKTRDDEDESIEDEEDTKQSASSDTGKSKEGDVDEEEDDDDEESQEAVDPTTSAINNQKTDEEKEKERLESETRLNEMQSSIEYGTILAFMDKFKPYLNLKSLNFPTFESLLIDNKSCKPFNSLKKLSILRVLN